MENGILGSRHDQFGQITGAGNVSAGQSTGIDVIGIRHAQNLCLDIHCRDEALHKNGVTRKIWFEEDKSIEEKLKVVVDNNTAGIAVWKLGLEKASVWNVINQYIND